MYQVYFNIFLGFTFLICIWLLYRDKPDNKLLVFQLAYFLITGNLDNLLIIALPGFSLFELQPDRLIFLFYSAYLILLYISPATRHIFKRFREVPWFEIILVLYVISAVISQSTHFQHLGVATFIRNLTYLLSTLVIYWFLKFTADVRMLKVIFWAILIGGVLTSLVAIVQFVGDPMFLRIGDTREAFGSVIRSNGVFQTEYFHSYFVITAISWTLLLVQSDRTKIVLVGIMLLGIFCSFQRMSWLVSFLVVGSYLLFVRRVGAQFYWYTGLSALSAIMLVMFLYSDKILGSDLVKERVATDAGGRAGYYEMVYDHYQDKPWFGFGDKKNSVYFQSMLKITGGSLERARGDTGSVHNTYLETLFIYGIPSFILFVLLVLSSVLYFVRHTQRSQVFAVPLFVTLLYMVANLTNTFNFGGYVATLYIIHLGIGMGLKRMLQQSNFDFSELYIE